MPVIRRVWDLPSIEVEPPNTRYLKLVASPETGESKNASVIVSYIPPGGGTGKHAHLECDEIIYCVGRGEATVNGKVTPLETDTAVVVEKGAEHEFRNPSKTETLKLLCIYVPALRSTAWLSELAHKTAAHLREGMPEDRSAGRK